MVKQLDDMGFPELLDHIGVDLWRAADLWKREFDAGMVAMGHAWFTQARAAIIPHVGRGGIRQAELAVRLRMTKQAVQQLVDELEADGIVTREQDPADARGRILVFTARGRRALADANVVKRRVEAAFRSKLGPQRFEALATSLRTLMEGEASVY